MAPNVEALCWLYVCCITLATPVSSSHSGTFIIVCFPPSRYAIVRKHMCVFKPSKHGLPNEAIVANAEFNELSVDAIHATADSH
jgi:hypothetical protein